MEYSAYFFDLGGTLVAIADDEIRLDDGRVKLLDGVREGLARLRGCKVFVITNQAGVALGTLREETARGFIEQVDAAVGGVITDYRICMHHPAAGCACRKPQPGMVLKLARVYGVAVADALLVGDSANDRECARRAGVGAFIDADEYFGRG